jgi:hypothetical protein
MALGIKGCLRIRLPTSPPPVRRFYRKCGNLDVSTTVWASQASYKISVTIIVIIIIIIILWNLNYILSMRRHRLDAFFLLQVYFGFKFCPSLLEIVGLRVPARYVRDFSLFNVCSSGKNCPSARCASAAKMVFKEVDVFGFRNILFHHLL